MDGRIRLTWVAVLLAVGLAGCAKPRTASQPWGTKLEPMAGPVEVDEPARVETSDRASVRKPSSDEPASPTPTLTEEIQQYVGRFPSDDQERKASPRPEPPAQPTETQRSVAEPSRPEQTNVTDPPTGKPALVRMPTKQTTPQAPATPPVPQKQTASAKTPAAVEVAIPPDKAVEPPKVELVAVRPAVATEASRPATGGTPNQPVEPIARPAGDSVAAMIERLESSVAAHPEQLDDVYKLALLHLAMEGDDKASGVAKKADPIRGDLIAAVVDVVRTTRQAIREPGTSASSALEAAEHLRTLLAQRSSVTISRVAFVTSVQSFGVYQEVPARFPAGQGVHVFLYSEVANFRSQPTGDGRLKTLLSEAVEIYDADGNVIWRESHPDIQDVVLTPRRDFFIPLEIKLPADTPAGKYTLKVKIEDKVGLTTDQRRLTFVIGNP